MLYIICIYHQLLRFSELKSFFEHSYRQTTSAQCCWCYKIWIPWRISVHEGLSILTDSSWPVFSPMIVNSYWFTKFTLRSLIAILYRAATVHVNLSKLLAPQMHVTSDISFLFPPNPSLWLFILDACRVYAERVKNPSVCVCVCKSKCAAALCGQKPASVQTYVYYIRMETKCFWPTWPPTPKKWKGFV